MFNLIIPSSLKEKLTPSSTDTLVHVLYLQWAYILSQIIILNLSKEQVGDWGSLIIPIMGGCIPAILLYRMVRRWRKKEIRKGTKEHRGENKDAPDEQNLPNKKGDEPDNVATKAAASEKPTSAFYLWFNEVGRELVMEDEPGMELKEVARMGGKIWRALEKEERQRWKKKLVKCKEMYEKERKRMEQKQQ